MADFIPYTDRETEFNPVVETATFALDFEIYNNSDVDVYLDGVATTDFTITSTYVFGISTDAEVVPDTPANWVDKQVLIVGARDPRIETKFADGAGTPAASHNLHNRRVVGILQEDKNRLSYGLKLPWGTADSVPRDFPVALEDQALIGLANGGVSANGPTVDEISNAQGYASAAAASAALAIASVEDKQEAFDTIALASAGGVTALAQGRELNDIVRVKKSLFEKVPAEPAHAAKIYDGASYWEIMDDALHLEAFGWEADMTADLLAQRNAFSDAHDAAASQGRPLLLPDGLSPCTLLNAQLQTKPLLLVGHNPNTTKLMFDDTQGDHLFYRDGGAPGRIDFFDLRNLGIEGTWTTNQSVSDVGPDRVFPCLIYAADHTSIIDVNARDIRDSAFELRDSSTNVVHNLHGKRICRALYNYSVCNSTIIGDVTLIDGHDDTIASHTENADKDNGDITINNVYIEGGLGINLQGVKSATISDVRGSRMIYHGLSITHLDLGGGLHEGYTSNVSISLDNIHFRDLYSTAGLDSYYSATSAYFRLEQAPRGDDGDGKVPGRNNVSDGSINTTESGLYNSGTTGVKLAGSYGISVTNCSGMRTRDYTVGARYNDNGFGQLFTRDGYKDPEVHVLAADGTPNDTVSLGDVTGVRFTGFHDFLRMDNVNLIGMQYGLNGAAGANFRRSKFSNMTLAKLEGGAIFADISGEMENTLQLDNVLIDLDPEMQHADRVGVTSGWSALNDAVGISADGVSGISVINSTFANCSRPIWMPDTNYTWNNKIRGLPAAIGFSTLNLGVGNVEETAGGKWIYELTEEDRTSAAWGNVTGHMLRSSDVMPTSGFYIAGHFVEYNGAAGYLGWLRLTTGSGHVLDTDWRLIEGYTTAEKTKLSGIDTAATANATDAALRDRTTHTGVQAISTVTGLQTDLDNGRIQEIVDYTATGSDTLTISSTIVGANSVLFIDIFDSGDALELLVGDDTAFLTGAADYTYGFDAAGEATENSVDTTSAFMRVAFVGEASGVINITADGVNKRASATTKATHTGLTKIYNTHSYTNAASDITRLKFTGPSEGNIAINTRIVVKGYPG